jgi:hypothetical protein
VHPQPLARAGGAGHRGLAPHIERVRGGHGPLGQGGQPGLGVQRLPLVHDQVGYTRPSSPVKPRGPWVRSSGRNEHGRRIAARAAEELTVDAAPAIDLLAGRLIGPASAY